MFDIFNKNKLKDTEKEKNRYKELYIQNNNIINSLQKECNKLNKSNVELIENNIKLVEWIYKILDNFGTCDFQRGKTFKIPVHRKTEKIFQDGFSKPYIEETITVPEIIISKIKEY